MKTFRKQLKALWKDESAQGATEYILLLVAIVALVMLFRKQLIGDDGQSGVVGNLVTGLKDQISRATGQ
jgi:Flp pilus assembly pilin Flp